MGAFESGQAFLAGVLEKLPAELRAQAQEVFGKPEAKEAIVVVGDGALARPDYSRSMDDLKKREAELAAQRETLNGWFADNKAALEEYLAIKPEYDKLKAAPPPKPGDPPKEPAKAVDPDEIRRLIDEEISKQGRDYIAVSAWIDAKMAQHQRLFGEAEPFDPLTLVHNAKLGKPIAGQPGRVFTLQDAYDEQFGAKVAAKQKEQADAAIEKRVQDRLAEERSKHAGQPFPLRSESPSVLDVLTSKEGPEAHTLDAAVAEFERLQAARGA